MRSLSSLTARLLEAVEARSRAVWRRLPAHRRLGLMRRWPLLGDLAAGLQRHARDRLDYAAWITANDTLSEDDMAAIRRHIEAMAAPPLLSVVMPVYDPPLAFLEEAISSVVGQLYPHWQLCIADDATPNPEVARRLDEWAAADGRIKVVHRPENGHISAASNSALAVATGEFVVLMDHDDLLAPHALYMVAAELEAHPDADLIYSDEDKIDDCGRRYDPYFKSDWNPELILGQNMVNHLGAYRRSLLTKVGGFREGFEGSQDHDLVLRVSAATTPSRIRHLPFVLYHWRVFGGSMSFSNRSLERAQTAGLRAIDEHLAGRGEAARAELLPIGFYRVRRSLAEPLPRVALIVATRDRLPLLRTCVDGLLAATDYPALEVVIVDNDSVEPATLAWLDAIQADARVGVLRYRGPFNFSAIHNYAVAQCDAELIGLINNDIEVIDAGWLREMVALAALPGVGAVGARLLYPDRRVQHGGVVLGVGGVAGHAHKLFAETTPGHGWRLQLSQDLSAVTAACMVLRRERYLEVGGLDADRLAVAFNDVDLCLKLRAAGHRIIWTPFATLLHHESASRGSDIAPEKAERFQREVAVMRERWGDVLAHDPFYNPNLSLTHEDFRLAATSRAVRPWRRFTIG